MSTPLTRRSLLARVRDVHDEAAWSEFVELYAPLLYRHARRQGLQDSDAADVTQNVLRTVVGRLPHFEYDRERGRFRGWLLTVIANEIRDFFSAGQRTVRGSGDSAVRAVIEQTPDSDAGDEAAWEKEYRQRVFEWAAERIRPHFEESTWDAFWRTAVANQPAADVARQFNMSVAAVYVAKSRVLQRLREQVRRELDDDLDDSAESPVRSGGFGGSYEGRGL